MCFTIERQKVAKIALTDIVCYKALDKRADKLVSPYQGTVWTVGVVKKVPTLDRISDRYSIDKGLHAGKTFAEAKTHGQAVYEAVIPKGSLYYENSVHYVSEQMKLVSDKPLKRAKYIKKK